MARKSIKGYAEKNYYDNTRFNGGIIATHDPLNEGYFKQLVNFDISDMGQSLTPRKGFLTTTLHHNNVYDKDSTYSLGVNSLSNKTIYFYDENLGEYIFVDFTNTNNSVTPAWRVKFGIKDNFIRDCKHIENVDTTEISIDIKSIVPVYTNQALRIVDEYMVTSYIVKVTDESTQLWLKLYYRENETKDGSTTYSGNTLVVSYLDFSDIVEYVNPIYRNLASSANIIPNPIQTIYKKDEVPLGHVNKLPMIYTYDTATQKYYINTVNEISGLQIQPHFIVAEDDTKYKWCYTYEIHPTSEFKDYTEYVSYKAPVHYLNTWVTGNPTPIIENYADTNIMYHAQYQKQKYDETIKQCESSIEDYTSYLNSMRTNAEEYIIGSGVPELVIYVAPRSDYGFYRKMVTNEDLLGDFGLFSEFTPTLLLEQDNHDEETYDLHKGHNDFVRSKKGIFGSYCIISNASSLNPTSDDLKTPFDFLSYLHNNLHHPTQNGLGCNIYIQKVPTKSIADKGVTGSFNNFIETYLHSGIYVFPMMLDSGSILYSDSMQGTLPPDYPEFQNPPNNQYSYIKNHLIKNSTCVLFKILNTSTKVYLDLNISELHGDYSKLKSIFPYKNNYVCTTIPVKDGKIDLPETIRHDRILDSSGNTNMSFIFDHTDLGYNKLFFTSGPSSSSRISVLPLLQGDLSIPKYIWHSANSTYGKGLFTRYYDSPNAPLIGLLNASNSLFNYLNTRDYFSNGLLLTFYLIRIPIDYFDDEIKLRPDIMLFPKLSLSYQLIKSYDEPSTYVTTLITEPQFIYNANNHLIFNSSLGDHLVLYINNKVFISVENKPYYFIQDYMKEYPEPVVKVIQYKDMLLVFTTQNLYAIYLYEDVTYTTETDSEGNTQNVQQKILKWATLPVLYNLMVNEKYKDAIQVYNQMVLFYSSDGQMFLIKPTAAIDSNTRFSIQYFNKSANDILLNYKDYMQERLVAYDIDKVITDVTIKVSATINYIKIFYTAKDIMTFILVYDVLNNRYYTYDTLSFSNIKSLHYIPEGEMYITEFDNNLYFTVPYDNKNYIINTEDDLPDDIFNSLNETNDNIDKAYYDNFSPTPINCEIDTGTINLNNHLKKRFKDLHVIYKNLNANELEFKLETYVDDVPIITYVDTNIEVRNVSNHNVLVSVDVNNVKQLIDNSCLFNFTDYSSNKILTHKTNIVSKGKTIRIKMNFSSKGKYKIQGYGLIYKEHTV